VDGGGGALGGGEGERVKRQQVGEEDGTRRVSPKTDAKLFLMDRKNSVKKLGGRSRSRAVTHR